MINGQKIAQAIQIIIEIDSASQELDLAYKRVNTITSRIDEKMDHLARCLLSSGLNDSLFYGNAVYSIDGGGVIRTSKFNENAPPHDDQSDNVSNF